jgi:uncharacterized protein (DUF427 family)
MSMTAVWNGKVIAKSDAGIFVDGNYYFPLGSVRREFLHESDHRSLCPRKGEAYFFDVIVDGRENPNAAWYYPAPEQRARQLDGYVAFWKGVEVSEKA